MEVTSFVLKYVGRTLSGGEYTKAAKSSETMAFDCPLVCPEISGELQGVSQQQHSAAPSDVGGLTIRANITKEKLEYNLNIKHQVLKQSSLCVYQILFFNELVFISVSCQTSGPFQIGLQYTAILQNMHLQVR